MYEKLYFLVLCLLFTDADIEYALQDSSVEYLKDTNLTDLGK